MLCATDSSIQVSIPVPDAKIGDEADPVDLSQLHYLTLHTYSLLDFGCQNRHRDACLVITAVLLPMCLFLSTVVSSKDLYSRI